MLQFSIHGEKLECCHFELWEFFRSDAQSSVVHRMSGCLVDDEHFPWKQKTRYRRQDVFAILMPEVELMEIAYGHIVPFQVKKFVDGFVSVDHVDGEFQMSDRTIFRMVCMTIKIKCKVHRLAI